ncbi:hypothetical protein FLONG3_8004 [Fusarium longipes]|uniref:Uncharacterized protein n=1 Tax=Fusarium longipes TaxID=694270 RepID=A0A395S964_9HYPO|nr:hypothetical protein FLONG3_8004 [Fusarium longipes]
MEPDGSSSQEATCLPHLPVKYRLDQFLVVERSKPRWRVEETIDCDSPSLLILVWVFSPPVSIILVAPNKDSETNKERNAYVNLLADFNIKYKSIIVLGDLDLAESGASGAHQPARRLRIGGPESFKFSPKACRKGKKDKDDLGDLELAEFTLRGIRRTLQKPAEDVAL